ncbi:translation initiation factor IF-2-like [Cebus imitator]|uniref:translation initiation factor IF-2-like n=1 Tax=Cebus imitator TaxID=2715852 RepID=UPI000809C66D|nr:translation initiation factor IF-2-like [Cebus imitator]
MPTFSGQLRSRLSPLLPPRRRRPLQSPPGRSAPRQREARVAFPSPPPGPQPPASPELSVAQTSPPGPARPSPHAPQTLSNPLGSRRLLGEETLAAAGAGAARLRAGRRRGARYGEPSNEARAGAQRRRVLAEHGRGAAAATVAAGAQGPLHHWQPWSPSIFLPQGRRLGSAHVLGEEGAGARASPEGGGTCARAEGATLSCPLPPQPARPHPAAPTARREGAAGGGGSFLGGVGGQTGWCSDCSRRRSKEREERLQKSRD